MYNFKVVGTVPSSVKEPSSALRFVIFLLLPFPSLATIPNTGEGSISSSFRPSLRQGRRKGGTLYSLELYDIREGVRVRGIIIRNSCFEWKCLDVLLDTFRILFSLTDWIGIDFFLFLFRGIFVSWTRELIRWVDEFRFIFFLVEEYFCASSKKNTY